jgi:predicted DNA-binding helix-hairpin-helix protein
VLMTNACSFNCHYCPMRRDRAMPRTLLKPVELVRMFLAAKARGWCSGLFITTGIPGRPTTVMDTLIEVLELLRFTHRFTGYVHVKMVPGGDAEQIARLTQLANRVSINLEAPCGASLEQIAPDKNFSTTLVSLERARARVVDEWAEEGIGKPRDTLRPGGTSGMTTQFVVGATPDTDRTIIGKVTELYKVGGVHHTHFSAFRPIIDTPMENVRATPALREQRLYQTDYLLRSYGFGSDEVVYDAGGNLPLDVDPKTAWALAHPQVFPVDLSRASYRELVRVPGIGPLSARRIIASRRSAVIVQLADLRQLGVVTTRAAGFVSVRGRRFSDVRWADQLGFWRPEQEVGARQQVYTVSPGTFR